MMSTTINTGSRRIFLPRRYTLGRVTWLCLTLFFPVLLQASTPSPFTAEYEARFGGFRAEASRSLEFNTNNRIEMTTSLQLKLLGQTVSSVAEQSILMSDPDSEGYRPLGYAYVQKGLGKRSRYIDFNWKDSIALTNSGDREKQIPLDGLTTDNLSAYLEIRKQLQAGNSEVVFSGIDKGELEEFRFHVVGEEITTTSLGDFRAVKLERIREPGSDRTTEIWLALDWDYILIKLVQEEPGSSTIELELKQATLGDEKVTALQPDSEQTPA